MIYLGNGLWLSDSIGLSSERWRGDGGNLREVCIERWRLHKYTESIIDIDIINCASTLDITD